MPAALSFSWTPRPDDWAQAMRATMPLYRLAPWFAFALVVVTAVAIALAPAQFLFGLPVLLVAGLIAVLPRLSVAAMFRSDETLAAAMSATADERALHLRTSAARSDIAWEQLAGWRQTSTVFVLRTGTKPANPLHVVPLRAFVDEAGAAEFRELLTRRVGPRDAIRAPETPGRTQQGPV